MDSARRSFTLSTVTSRRPTAPPALALHATLLLCTVLGACGGTENTASEGATLTEASKAPPPNDAPATEPAVARLLTTRTCKGCKLKRAALHGKDLQRVDLEGAYLYRADLQKADLRGANLEQTVLQGASLQGANLAGVDLRAAKLATANLQGANLTGSKLRGLGDLQGVDLRNATLRGADLREVTAYGPGGPANVLPASHALEPDQGGVRMDGADLSGADLRGAYLFNASLIGANLRGADLRGTKLSRADLSNADLQGARLDPSTDFEDARTSGAVWTDGRRCPPTASGRCRR